MMVTKSFSERTRGRLLACRSIDENNCWNWTGYVDKNSGRGRMYLAGKNMTVGRAAYVGFHGRWPKEGIYVCHHCDNRRCFNPDHLYEGTHKQNMEDMVRRKRQWLQVCPSPYKGENHFLAKLTEEDVRTMFTLRAGGYTQMQIAKKMSLSQSHVSEILSKKRWSHLWA